MLYYKLISLSLSLCLNAITAMQLRERDPRFPDKNWNPGEKGIPQGS